MTKVSMSCLSTVDPLANAVPVARAPYAADAYPRRARP